MKFCIFIAAVSIIEVSSQIFMINFTATCGYSEGTSSEKYTSQILSGKFSKCPKLSLVREIPFWLEHQLSLCGKFPKTFIENWGKRKGRSRAFITYSNGMILHHSIGAIHTYYSLSLSRKTVFSHTCELHGWAAGWDDDGNRLQWTTLPLKNLLGRVLSLCAVPQAVAVYHYSSFTAYTRRSPALNYAWEL